MASPRISLLLKLLLFFALLLIGSTHVSATNNSPLLHKPRIRKMGKEYKNVGKAVVVSKPKKPTSDDVPWGGGYVPPILNNNP